MTTASKPATTTTATTAATPVKTGKAASTTTTKTVKETVVAPVATTPVKSETPAKKEAAPKKAAAKKAVESTVTTPAPAPAPTTTEIPASPTETAATPASEDVFGTRFSSLLERFTSLSNELREVTTTLRSLQKDHARFVRENTKKVSKRQTQLNVQRKPSGFAKPTLLSDEMYDFLGMNKNTLVVRNEVTRKLNEYVVTNNLRDTKDKRIIIPDAKLRKLLNFNDTESLNYFNIQRYIKHHFVKPEAPTATA